jgi:phospho-N-acetylmuramoyl-pentapeptide-transferase
MVIGFFLLLLHAHQAYSTAINVPFFKQFKPDLLIEPLTKSFWTYPLAFVPFYIFIVFIMVGSSNSVNLTDGLDGLAIGLMIIASGAMTALTYVSSHASFSQYLDLARLANSQELTVFCASMMGACVGFLWYNCHPAQVFMGDVGSLALGGGLGILAVLIKQEILLIFIGGVFVIEALSVILQVGSYKLRHGKRIFKMAPIHHHFEALGWSESKIIVRFWIAGLVMALFALATLKLR